MNRIEHLQLCVSLGSLVVVLLVAPHLCADTVLLKGGGKIPNCRVVKETDESVTLQTASGPMEVPRAYVRRIKKGPSIFHTYDQKLAKLAKDDAAGHYTLARWCQGKRGLRKEMSVLLRSVIAIDKDHTPARHMLGYVRNGEKWQKLPSLSVLVEIESKSESMQEDLERFLNSQLSSRGDVRFVSDLDGVKDIHKCSLSARVSIGRSPGPRFYGMDLGGATVHAEVNLDIRGKIVGKNERVSLTGEVSSKTSGARRQAVNDAIGRGSGKLHAFFDRLLQRRVKLVEAALSSPKEKTTALE